MVSWTRLARRTALVAALSFASGGALAVDLPPAPALPAASAGEDFSGWYLRGDVGAGLEAAPDLAASGWTAVQNGLVPPFAVSSFRNTTLSPSPSIDAGVGYALNAWLRTDATLEYRFGGRLQSLYAIADSARGPLLVSDGLSTGVSSIVALLNGYVDVGNFWGATPFVGAGVGVADNAASGVLDRGLALTAAGPAVPVGGFFSNAAKANFAWALMAGLDVDIAPNLKLELGYRYLNLGSIGVGGAHCFASPPACAAGGGGAVAARSRGALASNELRIGLVLLVGEPSSGPAPIVARY